MNLTEQELEALIRAAWKAGANWFACDEGFPCDCGKERHPDFDQWYRVNMDTEQV